MRFFTEYSKGKLSNIIYEAESIGEEEFWHVMDVEMKNSADSNDEKDYETDEEALGMIKFKTSKSNFQFSIYKIS